MLLVFDFFPFVPVLLLFYLVCHELCNRHTEIIEAEIKEKLHMPSVSIAIEHVILHGFTYFLLKQR